MAKYLIPTSEIENLTKKINSIKNKGADIVFEVGNEVVREYTPAHGPKMGIKCLEVEIEGEYKINDWTFVGTIEHGSSGNIIRSFDTSLERKIPSKYRTIGQECEHCHKIRDRKDTYLVYNDKTNEFKQVGKTCLMNYTNGLNAEFCARLVDVFAYIFKLEHPEEEKFNDELMSAFIRGQNANRYIETESIKPIIFGYVKKNGYIPKETISELIKIIFGAVANSTKEASTEEISKMNEWAKNIDASKGGYMWNAKVAWTKEYSEYRDIALLASFVNVYLKDIADRAANNNEYVGNIGDKITITDIKNIKSLYVKDNSRYSYYAESSTVWQIIDGDGHTYIWTTSSNLSDDTRVAKEIVATVKEHKDYKGTKQTVITRGKVTKWAEVKVEPKKSEPVINKGHEGFKSFFSYLNDIDD
jgi:hypothetical protein